MIHSIKLAIIGLGYVGLPLAVEFGKKRDVIGFDTNSRRVEDLKKGIDFTLEVTKEKLKNSLEFQIRDFELTEKDISVLYKSILISLKNSIKFL